MKAVNGCSLEDARARAARVKLLVLDVDGVLTDGGLYFDENGLAMKRFDVHDGIGIRIWKNAGFDVAVISGMAVPCVERRLEMLGITMYAGGHDDKVTYLDGFRQRLGLEWDEIAYLGDDWVDMAPMLAVGLPVAVANGTPDTKDVALLTTDRSGGHGAVRELIEFMLDARGLKKSLVEAWRQGRV